ncbi:uncharacterized protein SAPINGB_P004366 [Magnusiomyces paraingens]|uniref:RRM domain-containing protein n=1 Tax=Magnusiomyces paraingens TaxID=2606893 RepID=A0A5E8BWC4_9ASCO|nr:uncharacterized protein SAPINGB_P004366 [Saprochaete ingens]VVT54994.1 unnamed protein product [Saprochaete ingens]
MSNTPNGWKNTSRTTDSSSQNHPYSRNSAANKALRAFDQFKKSRMSGGFHNNNFNNNRHHQPHSMDSAGNPISSAALTDPMTPEQYDAAIALQQKAYHDTPVFSSSSSSSSSTSTSTSTNLSSSSLVVGPAAPPANSNSSSSSTKITSTQPQNLTVKRQRAGMVWTDPSLLEWDPSHFRLFVGNLSAEVTDEMLHRAFKYNPNPRPGASVNEARFPSLTKVRVVRDPKNQFRNKGYGFVAFSDPKDYFRAFKEMNGKYVGNHPIQLRKATTEIKPVISGTPNHAKKNKRPRDEPTAPMPSTAEAVMASTTMKTTVFKKIKKDEEKVNKEEEKKEEIQEKKVEKKEEVATVESPSTGSVPGSPATVDPAAAAAAAPRKRGFKRSTFVSKN